MIRLLLRHTVGRVMLLTTHQSRAYRRAARLPRPLWLAYLRLDPLRWEHRPGRDDHRRARISDDTSQIEQLPRQPWWLTNAD